MRGKTSLRRSDSRDDERDHPERRGVGEEREEHDPDEQRHGVVVREIVPSLKTRPKTRYSIVKSASGLSTDHT